MKETILAMKESNKKTILISLMALILITTTTAQRTPADIIYTSDLNTAQCSETFYGFEGTGYVQIYVVSDGKIINYNRISFNEDTGTTTNTVTASISNIPCGALITCVSYESDIDQEIQTTFNKNCNIIPTSTIPGDFGTIPTGNNTNASGPNFGTIPYNLTGNITGGLTGGKILGLSVTIVITLGGLIILSIILWTIKPLPIAFILFFAVLLMLTESMGVLTITPTLLGLITLIITIEILRRRYYST